MKVLFVFNLIYSYYEFAMNQKKSDIQADLHRSQAEIPVGTRVTTLSTAFGRFLGEEVSNRSRGISVPPIKAKGLFSSSSVSWEFNFHLKY